MIYVGTSGFKFADWKGTFYPEEVKERTGSSTTASGSTVWR